MPRRNDRVRLLEQVFADRMPELEAASSAAAEVEGAREAVEAARRRLSMTTEHLRDAYDTALAAGWSDGDLALVGVVRPRRASPGRPRAAVVPDAANGARSPEAG